MSESIPSELLARYLTGEATPEERGSVERWASADPSNQAELDRLRLMWRAGRARTWDVNRAWERVGAQLDHPARSSRAAWPLALAAGLALLVGGFLAWRAIQPADPGPGSAVPNVVATGPGQQRGLELPDGSRLILAPNSQATIGPGYGNGERRIQLSGEAWFEVRHDASRPFRVYSAGTVTEDLGTEFSIQDLGSSGVKVVLVSGSASLRRADAPERTAVVLRPRDVGLLAAGDSVVRVQANAPVETLVSWRTGVISFQDAPIDSVIAELSRWYTVGFVVGDSALAIRRFSGPVRIDDLQEAIEVLTLSLGVRAERQGDLVVLR